MEKETLADITAVILTFNEEKHIERCIESIKFVVKRIVVIDSFSTDETLNILKKYNAEIFQNKWVNYATQMNLGIEKAKINTNWILRLDADEFFTEGLSNEIKEKLNGFPSNIAGVSINRRFFFLGKEIKFGGIFPQKIIRIWRNGRGKVDDIFFDEHVLVKGEITHVNNDIIDKNLNNIAWWIKKHKKYSDLEAINIFLTKKNKMNNLLKRGQSEKLKFFLKYRIYYRTPYILRPLLFFFYRYFFRLGFFGWMAGSRFSFFTGIVV